VLRVGLLKWSSTFEAIHQVGWLIVHVFDRLVLQAVRSLEVGSAVDHQRVDGRLILSHLALFLAKVLW
jgi:hypothetical protein